MVTATPKYASIKVRPETWARLNAERKVPGESLDAVIRRLLDKRDSAAEAGK